jgi:primosomal protein N' (replication factor Y)
VVDEEHEASYKQGEGFRYSARDTAIVRARQENVPIVLGSATPSFESLLNVSLGKYSALTLPRRAGDAQLPTITCVDLRRTQSYSGISLTLQAAIAQRLERGEQCLMFVNRRGYAPVLLCQSCGWSAQCERCSARLVYHKQDSTLICHHCGAARRWTSEPRCCARPSVIAAGAGTERIEEGLKRLFPGVRVARIDRDSTRRKGSRAALFEAVHRNAVDVLVGTQMLAKGHHFPEVTLVGVLDADSLLYGADFRSTERLAQQIVQVAGRAGRAGKPGEVLVQTHFPGHPLLTRLLREGYAGFARRALQERRAAQLPPYTSLALLRAEAPGANAAPAFLDSLARALRAIANLGAEVLGPAPAPMQRRAGRYRWQLLLLAKSRTALKRALDHVLDVARDAAEARRVRWSLDIDPQDMI